MLERLARVTSLLGDLDDAIGIYEQAIAAALETGAYDAAARVGALERRLGT